MPLKLGPTKTSHVIAHLILTILWSIDESELFLSKTCAKRLGHLKETTTGGDLLSQARDVLRVIKPKNRVVLANICDLLYDIGATHADRDQDIVKRLASLFGPSLLRGLEPASAASIIIELVTHRTELSMTMCVGTKSNSTASISLPIVSVPSTLVVTPVLAAPVLSAVEPPSPTPTAPPCEHRDRDGFVPTTASICVSEASTTASEHIEDISIRRKSEDEDDASIDALDDELSTSMKPLSLDEQTKINERMLGQIQSILSGNTPEIRRRRAERDAERAERSEARANKRREAALRRAKEREGRLRERAEKERARRAHRHRDADEIGKS